MCPCNVHDIIRTAARASGHGVARGGAIAVGEGAAASPKAFRRGRRWLAQPPRPPRRGAPARPPGRSGARRGRDGTPCGGMARPAMPGVMQSPPGPPAATPPPLASPPGPAEPPVPRPAPPAPTAEPPDRRTIPRPGRGAGRRAPESAKAGRIGAPPGVTGVERASATEAGEVRGERAIADGGASSAGPDAPETVVPSPPRVPEEPPDGSRPGGRITTTRGAGSGAGSGARSGAGRTSRTVAGGARGTSSLPKPSTTACTPTETAMPATTAGRAVGRGIEDRLSGNLETLREFYHQTMRLARASHRVDGRGEPSTGESDAGGPLSAAGWTPQIRRHADAGREGRPPIHPGRRPA